MPLNGMLVDPSSSMPAAPDLSLNISPPSNSAPSSMCNDTGNNNNNNNNDDDDERDIGIDPWRRRRRSSSSTTHEGRLIMKCNSDSSISRTDHRNIHSQLAYTTELSLGNFNNPSSNGALDADISRWRRDFLRKNDQEIVIDDDEEEADEEEIAVQNHYNRLNHQRISHHHHQQQQQQHHHLHREVPFIDAPSTTSVVAGGGFSRPIKGIPVYHNRPFPFLPLDHNNNSNDPNNRMSFYPPWSPSSPCSPYSPLAGSSLDAAATTMILQSAGLPNSPNSPNGGAAFHRMVRLNNGALSSQDLHHPVLKSHQLLHQHQPHHHQFGLGSADHHGLMRSRFMPKFRRRGA
ncbi:hypothetical protein Syun_022612 [Stephania yunnanensis]|uniref:Uncharacterized protein n=1 Tax=Stephania yunnanensis TaxID=152371 RepID=A0AAP0F898_9MAGN